MSLQSVTSCKSKASEAQRMACTCILSVISVSPTTAFPSNILTTFDREGNYRPEVPTSNTKSDSVRQPLSATRASIAKPLRIWSSMAAQCFAVQPQSGEPADLQYPCSNTIDLITKTAEKCLRPPVLSSAGIERRNRPRT